MREKAIVLRRKIFVRETHNEEDFDKRGGRLIGLLAATTTACLSTTAVCRAQSFASFSEDFLTPAGQVPKVNTTEWFFFNSNGQFGRTHMGNIASVEKDADGTTYARLPLDKYHNGWPGFFKGVEMVTFKRFGLDTGPKEFTARIRLTTVRTGAIAALFPYSDSGNPSVNDEIDFEFLGQQLFSQPPTNQLWLNMHNNGVDLEDVGRNPRTTINGVDWRQWQTYRIRWYSNRVEWYLNGSLIKSENTSTAPGAVPDGSPNALQIHFNHWVPDATFPDAYYGGFQPVTDPALNIRYYFDVDYINVVSLSGASALQSTDTLIDTSSIVLSSATADIATNTVRLAFTGVLDAGSVPDLKHYIVSINGVQATVDGASYDSASSTIVLHLQEALQVSNEVVAAAYGLLDAKGLKLKDQLSSMVTVGKV